METTITKQAMCAFCNKPAPESEMIWRELHYRKRKKGRLVWVVESGNCCEKCAEH